MVLSERASRPLASPAVMQGPFCMFLASAGDTVLSWVGVMLAPGDHLGFRVMAPGTAASSCCFLEEFVSGTCPFPRLAGFTREASGPRCHKLRVAAAKATRHGAQGAPRGRLASAPAHLSAGGPSRLCGERLCSPERRGCPAPVHPHFTPPCRYEAELSPVDQKLSALRSPLAQRPFFETPSGLGTVDLYECGDDDLQPS